MYHRLETPLRCICRQHVSKPEYSVAQRRGSAIGRTFSRMSFRSDSSFDTNNDSFGSLSSEDIDHSMKSSSISGSSSKGARVRPYNNNNNNNGHGHDAVAIDDLVEELAAEATKRYAVATTATTTTATTLQLCRSRLAPEQRLIHLVVHRLEDCNVRDAHDAGKSYYELRLVSDIPAHNNITTADYNHCQYMDSSSIIGATTVSALIGYAGLTGIDQGERVRRFTFQDSQHLYFFCQLLGEKGRFEEAAF